MYKRVVTALQSRTFYRVLPLLILAGFASIFWLHVNKLPNLIYLLSDIQGEAVAIIFLLTFLNLFLETQKWLSLMGEREISLRLGFQSVLYGICSGIFTPNRLGEFVGRSALLPKQIRKKGVMMTLAGSVIQGMITLLFGIVGFFHFPLFAKLKPIIQLNAKVFLTVGFILFGILLGIIFRKKLIRYLRQYFDSIRHVAKKQIFTATSFGILRYLVFSSQFAIALYACGFSGSLFICYSGIFLLYLCQSYIPLAPLGELGIRELLAVLIFGSFMPNPVLALVASLMIWVANIGIPVLIGSLAIKFSKKAIFGKL